MNDIHSNFEFLQPTHPPTDSAYDFVCCLNVLVSRSQDVLQKDDGHVAAHGGQLGTGQPTLGTAGHQNSTFLPVRI